MASEIVAVFSLLSAALWFASAAVRMPGRVWIVSHVGLGGQSDDVDKLVNRLRWQSRLSGAAAVCAGVAAFAQFVVAYGITH